MLWDEHHLSKPENRMQAEQFVMTVLAGPMAEARCLGKLRWRLQHSDLASTQPLIHCHSRCSGSKGARAYLNNLEARTKELLELAWPRVEAVAKLLVERRTIYGVEVDRILQTVELKPAQRDDVS
jgi:hypothetical protein